MATFGDLKAYVVAAGWTEERNLGRGRRRTGDHWRYSLTLPDGRVLRTKVSHSVRDEIGPDLFKHILRGQLEVGEAAFWATVRGRRQAVAPDARAPLPLPGWLVERLTAMVGLSDEEVAAMTTAQAQAAWDSYQSRERP